MKSRDVKSQRREEKKKEDQKRERLRRKKIQVREKVGKSRNTVFLPMICGSGGSKSRLAKAAGAEPAGQMRDDKLHAVVARSTKNWRVQSTFGCCAVEKVHAVVARSTFPSENAQSTSTLEPFLKLWCRKSACRCRTKHTSKSKCIRMYKAPQPRTIFLSWDVEKVYAVVAPSTFASEKAKKYFTLRALLDVQMSFRAAGARDCAPCQKWAKRADFAAV